MDSIEEYRAIIKRVILEVADFAPDQARIRKEVILDNARNLTAPRRNVQYQPDEL